ncbi:MAG: hypothetical protein IJZ17_06145 [Muribaculaceae bacterium]|nr:hypothetical protein [Muribaculaceae bacterium]
MAEIKIAAIMRARIFSPNHIANDAAILNATADQLRKRGYEVNVYAEEQFIAGAVDEHIIVHMCRDMKSIRLLQKLEDDGAIVVNSGYGIENCIRERLARILPGSGVPYPDSIIVNTDEAVTTKLKEKNLSQCWIKKGDFHSMHKEDVSYARHPEEAQEMLQEYFLRGIKRAVINRHLEGDWVKFYGVKGTSFFYWFYPFDTSYNKINGQQQGTKFVERRMKEICQKAAEELNVEVYGGDCIISNEGDFHIIDFNDWPSFGPCRAEAAAQIAKCVISMIKKHKAQ